MLPHISLRSTCCFCSFYFVATFALFSLFSFPVLAANSKGSLQQFVDAGRIPPGIKKKIDESGVSEVLITLDVEDIRNFARSKRNGRGLKFNNKTIIDEISLRYAGRKSNILSRLLKGNYLSERKFYHLPVMHLRVNEQAPEELLNMDEVSLIGENLGLDPHLVESLELVEANQTHSAGYTGQNTAVAVLDTGVDYTLPDFGSCSAPGDPPPCKVAYVQDFAPEDFQLDDGNGHGTNVSGIVVGVAPDTKIIGLDVFRSDGKAYYSDILAAIDWVYGNKDTYNIVAVNMSLGGNRYTSECPSDSIAIAISGLKNDKGIATAVSSGNDGYLDALDSPACGPDAISVGAVYDANVGSVHYSNCTDSSSAADKVTCFSNSASFLKLLAPGSLINSAGYTMAGTSQAAPHVAGAIAVLKEANSLLSPDEVVSLLSDTGVPVTDYRNSIVTPRIDLYSALYDLQSPVADFTGTPLSGEKPLFVAFSDSSQLFPDSWSWDFGDGGTSIQQNPIHVYENVGTYDVTLTVSNVYGTDMLTQSLYVDVTPCLNQPAFIDPFGFSSLQEAYNTAIDGDVIKGQAVEFQEDLVLDRDVNITLSGGYNCDYTETNPIATRVNGSLTISNGSVTVENLVIQ